ncbi:MAG: PspC domain-containing protein [Candidatus Micrarchaeota archaeon]
MAKNTEKKRLYRSCDDKMFGGVCAGIAEYLDTDPTIIRVLWVLGSFWGPGVLLYIILWIIIPCNTNCKQ